MTAAGASRAGRTGRTSRLVRWLLGGQIALAVLLVLMDIGPNIPRLLSPSTAPGLDQPTRPGDQTRYFPARMPARPAPGLDPDMPRRLLVERVVIDGVQGVHLRGAISPGDGDRVAAELLSVRPSVVTLDSPGGSVADALLIGRVVRDFAADTLLTDRAVCLSACPYAFVGGITRRMAEDARFGVHQHSFGTSTILPAFLAVEGIQSGQAEVLAHLDAMGIDLRVMGPAMATPADEIYILSPDELRDWNIVTD